MHRFRNEEPSNRSENAAPLTARPYPTWSQLSLAKKYRPVAWPMPDDKADRKFVVVIVAVAVNVSRRVTSLNRLGRNARERPPTFPFRVAGNFDVTPSRARTGLPANGLMAVSWEKI